MAHLRLAQSLPAVFYLPHLVAEALGAFLEQDLSVEVVTSFGQQWALLDRGEADVAIGGPMRNVGHYLRTGERIVNFCASLSANTWFLIAREPVTPFSWSNLAGRTVLGLADAPQGVCLRWILLRNDIDPARVTFVSGKDVADEIEMFRGGSGDYLLHSLHSAASLVRHGEGFCVQELATPTGPVPWSTYAALPSILHDRRSDLQRFTRAIAQALEWIAEQPADAIAALVAPQFPEWTRADLSNAIDTYKPLQTWRREPLIPRKDWERYCALYVEAGALAKSVDYEVLVDASFGEDRRVTPPPARSRPSPP